MAHKVSKKEMIQRVAKKTGIDQATVRKVHETLNEEIIEAVGNGEEFQVIGFGKFLRRLRAGRNYRNPQNGEKVTVSEHFAPVFQAGKEFRDRVKFPF